MTDSKRTRDSAIWFCGAISQKDSDLKTIYAPGSSPREGVDHTLTMPYRCHKCIRGMGNECEIKDVMYRLHANGRVKESTLEWRVWVW